jgi:hypothetical protein
VHVHTLELSAHTDIAHGSRARAIISKRKVIDSMRLLLTVLITTAYCQLAMPIPMVMSADSNFTIDPTLLTAMGGAGLGDGPEIVWFCGGRNITTYLTQGKQ